MNSLLLSSLLLWFTASQAIQTTNIVVGYKNFGREFTINGILNPQVLGVVHSMQTSFDLELISNITLDNTNVKFEVKIKIQSFTYASLIYQFLLISRRPEFEVQNGLVLSYDKPEMNFTSGKKLKSMPAGEGGDIAVHTFVTGWSSLAAMGYTSLVSSYNSEEQIFTITGVLADQPKRNGNNSWIIISVILIGESLIPQCPDSIFTLQPGIFAENREITMQENFTYLLGITQVFDYFVTMRYLEANNTITLIVGWSTMAIGYLGINNTCFAEAAGDMVVLSFFEKWKIIVIAVGISGGTLLMVGLVFFCRYWCDDGEEEEEKVLEESIAQINNVKDSVGHGEERGGDNRVEKSFSEVNNQTPDILMVKI